MDQVTVRRIRPGEALQLRELRLAALADAPHAFTTTHEEMVDKPVAFWADRVASNSEGEALATFIAEHGGEWVGMVAGIHPEPDDPQLELVAMWVAPHGRGLGAGAALVNAVVAWGREIGSPSVGLWVVRGNEHAIALYERCGFVMTADFVARPSDPCSGELRMTHEL